MHYYIALVIFATSLAILAPVASTAQNITGVASDLDADTIKIDGKRIRLFGIVACAYF